MCDGTLKVGQLPSAIFRLDSGRLYGYIDERNARLGRNYSQVQTCH